MEELARELYEKAMEIVGNPWISRGSIHYARSSTMTEVYTLGDPANPEAMLVKHGDNYVLIFLSEGEVYLIPGGDLQDVRKITGITEYGRKLRQQLAEEIIGGSAWSLMVTTERPAKNELKIVVEAYTTLTGI